MAGFLYYVPGADRSIGPAELARAGLSYAFDRPPTPRGCRGGPDGGDGVIVADDRHVTEIGYFPTRQEWRRGIGAGVSHPASAGGGTVWVGRFTGEAIGPEDLAQEKQLGGRYVALLDGNPWLAPIARGHAEEDGDPRWYVALPRRVHLDGDGHWQDGDVLARYLPLWQLAEAWNDVRSGTPIEDAGDGLRRQIVSFDGLITAAVESLAANYALGPVEVDLLGLLTEDLAVEILDALIDMPTRMAWVKKKLAAAAAGPSIAAGPADLTAATAPP